MLYVKYSMAFFLVVVFLGCKTKPKQLSLSYKNGLAVSIIIPKSLVLNQNEHKRIQIYRGGVKPLTAILGNFDVKADEIEFTPLIPLTYGIIYEVWENNKLIGSIDVPLPKGEKTPVLRAIYPQRDTVPENLLKFYFCFSKPMQTGRSLDFICLLDKNGDTMRNVFLNLQPELWDTSGKVLTIWIDPGRIKRDLVLNRKYGNPLTKNSTYRLMVSQQWKDSHGLNLGQNYTKTFTAKDMDHTMPIIDSWKINVPKANTQLPLIIDALEGMDAMLLKESLTVLDVNAQVIDGRSEVSKDQIWKFFPLKGWKAGIYQIRVNSRLEDLAANNFNRVFDRDVKKEKSNDGVFVTRKFKID